MRISALPFLLLAACAAQSEPDIRFVDLTGSVSSLTCSRARVPFEGETVAYLGQAPGRGLIAALPDLRKVMLLDSALQPIRTETFDKDGPRRVRVPVGAALVDSVLYVIDQQLPALRRFDPKGRPLQDVRLPFTPYALSAVGRKVVIVPAVRGRYPSSLLYTFEDEKLETQRLAPYEYGDAAVKMLGNLMNLATLDDRVLLVHQFLTPRAFLWKNGQAPTSVPVPLSRLARKSVGYIPPAPLDEAALRPALVISIAASADPARRQFLLLTRSGRMAGDRFEKVVIRTDRAFNYVDAFRLPINAGHMAIVPETRNVVFVDEDGGWFRCMLP